MATKTRVQRSRRPNNNGVELRTIARKLFRLFASLPDEARGEFLRLLLEDEQRREDILDLAIILERQDGPFIRWEDYLKRRGTR